MNDSTLRFLSAAFCLLCLTAVWCGAGLEIGRQKRAATISQRHFRWRMIAAALWTLILGLLAYATLRYWPSGPKYSAQYTESARHFVPLASTAIALLLPAFLLLIFDFYLTAQSRRLQTAHLNQDLGALARREIEQAQADAAAKRAQNPQSGGDS